MNALQTAAAEAFVEILRDAGVPVTIGGKDYQAMVSPSGLAINLEEGGFTQDGTLAVKLLVAHLPPPCPCVSREAAVPCRGRSCLWVHHSYPLAFLRASSDGGSIEEVFQIVHHNIRYEFQARRPSEADLKKDPNAKAVGRHLFIPT